jgi:hypothetical protein
MTESARDIFAREDVRALCAAMVASRQSRMEHSRTDQGRTDTMPP